ncbi:universal stress protein [bacterium]|nr:universal stress protein [bacterium]
MIGYKNILFPTDFSEFSNIALEHAVFIARKSSAKLYLLHIIEMFLPDPNAVLGVYENVADFYDGFEKKAQDRLNQLKLDERLKDLTVEAQIRLGKPFIEIIKFSKDLCIDCIVMGTHGQSALEHVFFGSTAEKIVRKSYCPVLTVKHPDCKFKIL